MTDSAGALVELRGVVVDYPARELTLTVRMAPARVLARSISGRPVDNRREEDLETVFGPDTVSIPPTPSSVVGSIAPVSVPSIDRVLVQSSDVALDENRSVFW